MENGANETFDDKWDKKYWEEIMDKEDWMYDDDVPTFRFGELKDKYDTAIEKIKNDLKLKDIKEKMQEGAKDTAERVKNSDSAKIVQSIVEEITPKINEIKELIGYLDTIKSEIDSRNIECSEMEMYEDEIKELEEWASLGKDVKQLVGEIAIDIGKSSLRGAGKLGKNIIGGTIIGAIKLGKGIKEFATGNIYKVKDPDSINTIKTKRNDIKNKKDYEIIVDEEEYEEDYFEGEFYPEGDYEIIVEEYDEDEYDEDEYDDYNLEDIERDSFFKRTIKGFKALGQGIKKTYKSSKENYGKVLAKSKKIKKDVAKTVKKVKSDLVKNVKDTKDSVVNTAKNVRDDVKKNVENTANEVKDKYEVAKDKFNKRKNDALLDVLEASGKFAKKILEDIGNSIKSKTEKLEKANEKITQRSEAKKESEQRDEDTMEM